MLGSLTLAEITAPLVRRWRADRLANGAGKPTIAKSYRLLHAIFATVVDDQVVRRNPCRIKGAGQDTATERSALSVDQVFRVVDGIDTRYRMLVLLAAFTSLRFGELAALRRADVDVESGDVHVRHSQAELRGGRLLVKAPKSEAGRRTVAIPSPLLSCLSDHLAVFGEPGQEGRVFIGPLGGRLRRHNFRRVWLRALGAAVLAGSDVHFHDLRHTGNQLAAVAGATTKELMARMGHSSVHAAMIYQHATREHDREIARAMGLNVKLPEAQGSDEVAEGHAEGTDAPNEQGEPAA